MPNDIELYRPKAALCKTFADPKIIRACDLVHEVLLNQIEENKELAERINHQISENTT